MARIVIRGYLGENTATKFILMTVLPLVGIFIIDGIIEYFNYYHPLIVATILASLFIAWAVFLAIYRIRLGCLITPDFIKVRGRSIPISDVSKIEFYTDKRLAVIYLKNGETIKISLVYAVDKDLIKNFAEEAKRRDILVIVV